MKRILLAASLTLLSAEAQAISRYTSTSMSCAEVKSIIREEGAVILRYRSLTSGVERFDRFVRSDHFCRPGQETRRSSVPSADSKSCSVDICGMKLRSRDFVWKHRN